MFTMKVALKAEMKQFVEQQVKSGRFASPEDVVHAALAVLMQHRAFEDLSTEELEAVFPDLRGKIARGLEDARAGRLSDGEAFFEELEREDRAVRGKGRKSA
jgi:putative addiction module CopG family antidote